MARISRLITQIEDHPEAASFSDLAKVCDYYFGKPSQKSVGQLVYRTPWQKDPYVNIQNKQGRAALYQIKRILVAITKLAKD